MIPLEHSFFSEAVFGRMNFTIFIFMKENRIEISKINKAQITKTF
jgi:hypothetical protein